MKKDLLLNFLKAMIPFWNIIIFCYVWVLYYNEQSFRDFWWQGLIISVVIYSVIYMSFGSLYHAFKIGTSRISELMLSQMLAVGIADLCMYFECCMMHRRFVNLIPGIAAVVIQFTGTLILLFINKSNFQKYVPIQKTLLIYGNKKKRPKEENIETSVEDFAEKIKQKHSNLFDIREMIPDTFDGKILLEKTEKYETVILCHVSQKLRAKVLAMGAWTEKNIYITPRLEDIFLSNYEYRHMIDTPLLKAVSVRNEYFGKRLFDITVSFIMLIIFSPFMLITAICIKLEDGGPVFYRQKRVTMRGREFEILKFRSMIVDAEKNGYKPAKGGDSRITKTGHVIRATRIDETPQLINILKGDMSIVGPRPERVEHVKKYTEQLPEFAYRLRVRGGLTGYAQIYGKYNTSAEDKLKMDLMYIEKQSFLFDLQLIMLTLKVMFLPESTEGFK